MGGGSGTLLVNDRASALLKNGFAFQRMGDYESAIENFTKALDSDPHSGEAHYGRGICHLQRGEFDRAIADFTRGSIETRLFERHMNVRPLVDLMLVLLIVFIMGGPLMGEGEAPGRSKAWRKRAAAYIRKSFALQESTASATSIARHMAS
jgi:tetratricopeptide (TPR) repeat protein